jgi:hypothetical protein
MTAPRIFGGLALALACVLAWELLPAAGDGPDIAAPRPEPVHARTGPDTAEPDTDLLASTADTLLERPLFSPSRRLAAAEPGSGGGGVEDIPRLSGVVIGPAGGRAIFDNGSGRSKIAAPGDSLGRFRIGGIAAGQVSLIASEGERVLRPRYANSAGAAGVPVASVNGAVR